jgi:parvulin-like peptidyl-prolyl isomerase
LADAALALKAPNEIGPVVVTPKGIHLIKILGRHDGYETSFDAAKSRIASRLEFEHRTRSIDDLATDLRKKANVRIDEKALARIDVDALGKPSGTGASPAIAGAMAT